MGLKLIQVSKCGFTSAVNLHFFRLSSTFSTIRVVKNPNLRTDLNPEKSSYNLLLTQNFLTISDVILLSSTNQAPAVTVPSYYICRPFCLARINRRPITGGLRNENQKCSDRHF
jgi:hypothetical protein